MASPVSSSSSSSAVSAAIASPLEHRKFLASTTKADLVGFVGRLNRSCQGRRRPDESSKSASTCIIPAIQTLLARVRAAVDATPAVTSREKRRYGDAAFKTFHAWLTREALSLVADAVSTPSGQEAPNAARQNKEEAVAELAAHLCRSFGDPGRLDYGTGHETAFLVFLFAFARLGALEEADVASGACALLAFGDYVALCRRVQTTYRLEPAGSRGVWALDDYQCLSFLFGSAQHVDPPVGASGGASRGRESFSNTEKKPAAFCTPDGRDLDRDMLRAEAPHSLFFQSLAYAASAKVGPAPFAEHSPVLFALSRKPWRAVNAAVFHYWDTEVLGTFVVARHLRFGRLFAADWTLAHDGKEEENQSDEDAAHSVSTRRRIAPQDATGLLPELLPLPADGGAEDPRTPPTGETTVEDAGDGLVRL